MEELEIGQKVTWKVGTVVSFGLFLDKIDDDYSSIKCYMMDGRKYICVVPVLTLLLSKTTEE